MNILKAEIQMDGSRSRLFIPGIDKKVALTPKNLLKSVQLRFIDKENYVQKVRANIGSLANKLNISKSSIVFYALIGKIDTHLAKVIPAPTIKPVPAPVTKPALPPIVKPKPIPAPIVKPTPAPKPPLSNFAHNLQLQDALYLSGKSMVSGEDIQKVYEIYKNQDQSDLKKAIHVFPSREQIVLLKLKNLNDPEILIVEGKASAFLSQGFHGKILKMSPLGSTTFSDKYVLKISLGAEGNASIINEYKVLKYIKSKIGNNRKAGIQKQPLAFSAIGQTHHCFAAKKAENDLGNANVRNMPEQFFLNNICLSLLKGLKTLSGLNVTHGDIHPKNCLLDSNGAYLADFGSATILYNEQGRIDTKIKPCVIAFSNQNDSIALNQSESSFPFINFFNPTAEQEKNELTISILKKRDVYALGKTLQILVKKYYGNRPPKSLMYCISRMISSDHQKRVTPEQAWEMWQKTVKSLKYPN